MAILCPLAATLDAIPIRPAETKPVTRFSRAIAFAGLPFLAAVLTAQEAQPVKPSIPIRTINAPTAAGVAQEPTQDELKQKLADKLARPFLQKASWTTDYDAARARAKAEKKLIFAHFTRSYAH